MERLNIALPKGRLSENALAMFSRIGLCEYADPGRKLTLEDKSGCRFLFVKPSDVAVYVEYGEADLGVVGRDVLLETEPDVFSLLDLGIGRCKVACAAMEGFEDDAGLPLRVATKYPRIAHDYYESIGRRTEIIKLSGSIELAAVLGLSDVIVDIVETGRTLKENNLRVIAVIAEISARLIANKAGFRFRTAEYNSILARLSEVTCK